MLRMFLCAALFAALQLTFAPASQAASIFSRLFASQPNNLTFEDDSRELLLDVDGNGGVSPGDVLVGYAAIGNTFNPATGVDNSIYAVFSQTFDGATFGSVTNGAGNTRYFGEFTATPSASIASLDNLLPNLSASIGGFAPGTMLAFVEVAGGFSQDLITANLPALGNVNGAITNILDAEGSLAFTAGLVNTEDFFAFETAFLPPSRDFVANGIAVTETISSSLILGNFGAGLSMTGNYLGSSVIFNRVIQSEFFVNGSDTNYGEGELYDLAITNGNFGGINTGDGSDPTALVQGGGMSFINNADAVVSATIVPEPSSIVAFLAVGALGVVGARRRRNRA